MSNQLVNKISREEFRGLMNALGEVFGEKPSESKIGLYYQVFEGRPVDVLKRAVKHLISNYRYGFPKPIDIEEAIKDSWKPEVIPESRRLENKSDPDDLSEEEKDYRSIFLRYYLFNIRRGTRGFKVGFVNYIKTAFNPKYTVNGRKELLERGFKKDYCLMLIEKYHKDNLFERMDT